MHSSTDASGLIFFPAGRVSETLARGGVLYDDRTPVNCAVHASRREGPGEAEVHAAESDLMFILTGVATLTTGGQVRSPREIAPGEIRGEGLEGGQRREIGPGDVFIIPAGTPHWFERVSGPMTYYTVKLRG
jgi:mannose-6-phosphate isomerase-like protein (cupin superfamily)